jgi:hypothetical protein
MGTARSLGGTARAACISLPWLLFKRCSTLVTRPTHY